MLLRDLDARSAGDGARWIAPSADIPELRSRRCRSIVVVTDYSGTGGQLLTIAESLVRSKTIRSWRSLGLIKIAVVAFAASAAALERLDRSAAVDQAWTVEIAPSIAGAPWAEDARAAVTDLCEQECRLRSRYALGHDSSGGLFATARSAPNNLPAVFHQSSDGWMPLFPQRSVPTEFADAVSHYRPQPSLAELAERVGQSRVGRNDRVRDMRYASRQLLAGLVVATEGPCKAGTLAARLNINQPEAAKILQELGQWGLISETGAVTPAGRLELAAHKRGRRRTTAFAEGDRSTYYPLHLR